MRKNGGGDPAAVTLVASYFFGPQPVHLNDLYFRPRDETQQYWTLPYLPGKRFAAKDVCVLTPWAGALTITSLLAGSSGAGAGKGILNGTGEGTADADGCAAAER